MNNYKILVICTGNSFRSQLAEGFFREYGQGKIEAHSAGVIASGRVAKSSIALMKEISIDISQHQSVPASSYNEDNFDYVITLGKVAQKLSPDFPQAKNKIHQEFPDPEKEEGESDEDLLNKKREVRELISTWVNDFVNQLD